MKKNIQLLEVVLRFLDNALMGIMIVNADAEVLYYNNRLESYFYDISNDENNHYGNIFNCEVVFDSKRICGHSKICKNCDLKLGLQKVVESGQAEEKIHYKRVYILNGEQVIKWFEISIGPYPLGDEAHFICYFNDVTEEMTYMKELELETTLSDDGNEHWKIKFHEQVMQCLSFKSYGLEGVHMMHIKVDTKLVDYTYNLFRYIYRHKAYENLVCRVNGDELLMFFPRATDEDIESFIKVLAEFDHSDLSNKPRHHYRLARWLFTDEIIDNINSENSMHLKYFNALSEFLISKEQYTEKTLV